ncbi:hypothetical protein [Chitinimonas lacunae]|uniref:Uncharacterized protein n=1 Tax=Chitinimonas lacunae TaxID=1963018 RepID=A0ABV8MML4_9NEIS
MSRSRRKKPIFAITSCTSERDEKKIWHRRLRTLERTAMAGTSAEAWSAYLPLLENQACTVWEMGKDGRHYQSPREFAEIAEHRANRQGRTPQERASLKKRLPHQRMGK